ncbi:MAG: cell division protein [Streptococcaceae bacterium]|jgi:RNA-binding protein YlmH|nr:cell division protein [Streptococcaceae bacterium]
MADAAYSFRPEERAFVSRCEDWLFQAQDRPILTYFLNPHERDVLRALAARASLTFFESAGEEYKRVLVSPSFYRVDDADFELLLLEVSYNAKFKQLTHVQILGTFLGETGVRREEIGDILVSGGTAQIYVSRRLVSAFEQQITRIARLPVSLQELPLNGALSASNGSFSVRADSTQKIILASSLRLDKIIAAALTISRNFAGNMIQSEQVKVNYTLADKNDALLKTGDLISIRGYGRIKIGAVLGQTKKQKFKLEISLMMNQKKR